MANHPQQDVNFKKRLQEALHRNNLHEKDGQVVEKQDDDGSVSSGLAQGMRMGMEFMSGTIAGFLLGWAIDTQFDTSPWFLLLGILLGFCAGILNIYRFIKGFDEGIALNRQSDLTKSPKDNIPERRK